MERRAIFSSIVVIITLILLYPFLFRKLVYFGKDEKIDPSQVPGELITISNSDRKVNAHLLLGKDLSKGIVILLHGQGGTMYGEARFFKYFYEHGYSALLVEYAGFGLSKQYSPSESNLYDDSEKIIKYVQDKYNFSKKKTILWGRSLGSGVALELSLRDISSHLILVTPYTSLAEVAKYKYSRFIPDFIILDKFDNLSKATKVRLPTLIIGAKLDTLTPAFMANQLNKQINGSTYIELINSDHFTINENITSLEWIKIVSFLQKI
ncbi:alpha/beta hydrolase [Leptospira koniambonensis]|uniref:alpha/beta hydrolase n=1 Tax=Leptospira koniambonensis TaxID=2484950 RepID=UPI003EBA5B7A